MTATTTTHRVGDAWMPSGGVVATPDPQATERPTPSPLTPAGHTSDQPTDHRTASIDVALAGRTSPHPTDEPAMPCDGASGGVSSVEPGPAIRAAFPGDHSPAGFDELRILAESFADAQDVRIRIENRLRSGTIPPDLAKSILNEQRRVEHMIGLAMRRQFRRCAPDIHAWVKDTPGIGEHLMARLIGTIGHPVIATPHHWEGEGADRVLVADPPFLRNVAKLWAYCGHGDPGRRKAKGMTADQAFALGSPKAKMLVHLLAESAMKCVGSGPTTDQNSPAAQRSRVRRRSPYRDTYEAARARYADRPDWTPGHQHNAALRLVGKEILRDLWRAAHPAIGLPTPARSTPVERPASSST